MDDARDIIASLGGDMEHFEQFLAVVSTAIAGNVGGLEAAIEQAAEEILNLSKPNAAELAKDLSEKVQSTFAGYHLYTRVAYKKCACGGLFHAWRNIWTEDKTTKTDWKVYGNSWDYGGMKDYQDKWDAYKDVKKACDASVKAWNEANKDNIETP